MAIGIIMIIGGFILFVVPVPFIGIIAIIRLTGIILFLYGIYRTLKGMKSFLFELIDHIKAPGKPDYTAEARQASENTAPKKDKHTVPPWEK